jgi:hypothetical protein
MTKEPMNKNAMWNDFNNTESQSNFDLIPAGTIAKVRMSIKPGGYDDENQGWTGGYATKNDVTGSIYLSCEFIILEGKYAKRKIWGLIGLHSHKGSEWANMGRSFIKAILNSSRGFSESDISHEAQDARRINGLSDLDGIEFLAKITTTKDGEYDSKNEIKFAITPDHKDYAKIMAKNISEPIKSNQEVSKPQKQPSGNNKLPAWAS